MKTCPFWLALILVLALTADAATTETVIKDPQGMDCHVYLPDPIDPDQVYQLLVGVHGAGTSSGKGAAGLAGWASRGDVIVIGPSFATRGADAYQDGKGVAAEKLIGLFSALGRDYRLRDKMFLHGFSGGSQFVHRFAMNHPELVCGVSAHSGGSWATDGYGRINPQAKGIPFAISCGANDNGKAWAEAPFSRVDWYQRFYQELDQSGFVHIGMVVPEVGHRFSPQASDLMRQCFQVATGLPGNTATERVEPSEQWKNLDALKDAARESQSGEPTLTRPVPRVNQGELERMARAAFERADKEQVADDLLVGFMRRYPPVLWKDMEGAARLLEQCERAASNWHQAASQRGSLSFRDQEDFARFSNGLSAAGKLSSR